MNAMAGTGEGFDFGQWRALVRVMLKIDMRAGFSMVKASSDKRKKGTRNMLGLIMVHLVFGGMLSFMMLALSDAFHMALVFHIALFTIVASSVMVEFHTVILSPDDYPVLGFRPVSSITFFMARLANVLVYTAIIGAALAVIPTLVIALRASSLPGLHALLLFAGALLDGVLASLVMVLVYMGLLHFAPAATVKRMAGYFQIGLMFVIYGSGMIFSTVFRHSSLMEVASATPGIWALAPPAWYASWLSLVSGSTAGGGVPWLMTVASVLAPAALVFIASRRMSLAYAARIAESSVQGGGAAGKAAAGHTFVAVKNHERHVIALLIRRHFVHDQKFRISVFSLLPITVIYLIPAFQRGALSIDPFEAPGTIAKSIDFLFLSIIFCPVLMKLALTRGDSWNCAWVYRSLPIDAARIVAAMKRFLVAWFFVPYLALLAIVLAAFNGSIVHSVLHVAMLGMLAHIVVQLEFMRNPALPFSQPIQKGQRMTALLITFLGPGASLVLFPMLEGWAYVDFARYGAVIAVLAVSTFALERMIGKRATAFHERGMRE